MVMFVGAEVNARSGRALSGRMRLPDGRFGPYRCAIAVTLIRILQAEKRVAKPNYQFEKRQRELKKAKRQEEKRLKKQERPEPDAPTSGEPQESGA